MTSDVIKHDFFSAPNINSGDDLIDIIKVEFQSKLLYYQTERLHR